MEISQRQLGKFIALAFIAIFVIFAFSMLPQAFKSIPERMSEIAPLFSR